MSGQMLWDLLAIAGSACACVFIFTRRRMLSGEHGLWHNAPGVVQAVLSIQAMFMGYVAVNIAFGGGHATPRETIAYILSAVVAIVMVRNLARTGRVEGPASRSAAVGQDRGMAR